MRIQRLASFLALAALALAGCDRDPTVQPGPEYPPRGVIVSGDLQQDTVGDLLPQALVVRATDQEGRALSGLTVTFTVTAGGGSVSPASAQTGTTGEASTRWTLGTVAGDTQRVEARMVDPGSGQPVLLAVFRAVGRPDAPATITAIPPAARTGSAGQALDSLAVVVRDAFGNAVPGVPVVWTVASGGGTLSPPTSTTNAQGIARAQWTLGYEVGTQQVAEASLSPAVRAQFTAMAGLPMGASLDKIAGDNQTGVAGTTLAEPMVVVLRSSLGQPIAGASITWTPAAGSGTATPPVSITGPDGRASTQWTLGPGAGPQQLMASAEGVTPVTFGATATPGAAATLEIVAGNGQTAPPNAPLPAMLAVRVTDTFGNPVQGATVTWTVTGGGGTLTPASVTGANGIAQAQWTLGPAAGPNTATASTPGTAPVSFTATGQVGPLASIEVTPDTVRFGSLGEVAQLTARGRDAYGNTVTGITFTWTSSNTPVATVDQTGKVTAVRNGTAQIRASAGGVTGTAAAIVQQAAATVEVSKGRSYVIQLDSVMASAVVRDARGNVIPGAPVTWSSSDPGAATVSPTGRIYGQGNGTPTITATSGTASGSTTIQAYAALRADTLSVGDQHSCALENGTAYCWGSNQTRQLGNDASEMSTIPVAVAGRTFTSISAGQVAWNYTPDQVSQTCAIDPAGDAYCWGANAYGQLGFTQTNTPTQPGGRLCGAVICTPTPTLVEGGHTWRQIDTGTHHTCAITTTGQTYCWGRNDLGQLGSTAGARNVCYVYTTPPSTVKCAQTPQPVPGGPYVQISAGDQFTCAVTAGGDAYCWGYNSHGQIGDGTGGSGNITRPTPTLVSGGHTFAEVSAGTQHACGRTTGNQVYCWGSNDNGQVGNSAIGGTVFRPALVRALEVPGEGTAAYRMVRAGFRHSCAVTTTSRAACWGDNAFGQLGDGTSFDRGRPGLVDTPHRFETVGAGYSVSCGLSTAGLGLCWGSAQRGGLGNGTTTTPYLRPGPVRGP